MRTGRPNPNLHPPLPLSRAEMEARGWDACDAIVVTGDAYIDHPAFGAGLIGRFLEALGLRIGVIAAPDLRDPQAFRVFGAPRLFWGITAGNLDSQLARLTVMRKRRRDDPYLPPALAERRPPNASIAYTARARQIARGVPVILGGLEASLRRFPYYDYWTDKVHRSILLDAKADLLVYGMAESALAEIVARLRRGAALDGIPGTAVLRPGGDDRDKNLPASTEIELPDFDTVAAPTEAGRLAFAAMTAAIHRNATATPPRPIVQRHGTRWLVVHPPAAPLTPAAMDALYALPFTRRPHPAYGAARIPAFEMIRDSITTHRGCYGGCAFCALALHQGKTVVSRSRAGILDEIARVQSAQGFHGTLSDLGGPTANMYGTRCRRATPCARASCLTPRICPDLDTDPRAWRELLYAARAVPGVRHVFVASGIRSDLALAQDDAAPGTLEALVAHHTGGRLKTAPEHTVDQVLAVMRKPPAAIQDKFLRRYKAAAAKAGKTQQPVVEYYISGHPGCTLDDMLTLALHLKAARPQPEQVQDYYPCPLTLAAAMYYTGFDPLTGAPVAVARSDADKADQRALLLCHLPEFQTRARAVLLRLGRADLVGRGKQCLVA